jgi:hypothetical protein
VTGSAVDSATKSLKREIQHRIKEFNACTIKKIITTFKRFVKDVQVPGFISALLGVLSADIVFDVI